MNTGTLEGTVKGSLRGTRRDDCQNGWVWRLVVPYPYMGVSENRGTLFWSPYNKDPTIWGTISGSPIFGNSHKASLYFGFRVYALSQL